jgi:hypothetical protein
MLAAYEEPQRPPKSRKVCPFCEATPAGCSSSHWLRGRHCCEACTGDHDEVVSHA